MKIYGVGEPKTMFLSKKCPIGGKKQKQKKNESIFIFRKFQKKRGCKHNILIFFFGIF